MDLLNTVNKMKPALRWAGGKLWMRDRINEMIPHEYNDYYEPFVGGGAVFLNLQFSNKAQISDCNKELIAFYRHVKTNLNSLIVELKKFKNDEKEFYKVRAYVPKKSLEVAARFYYLNRTCFNGIYRVNQEGLFNVPYGQRADINVVDSDALVLLKHKLKNVTIECCDFEESLKNVKKGDLIFLDPPYTVAHNQNGFISYNQTLFSWQDQERLADCVKKIIKKKAYFIMTNANHESIKSLYCNVGRQYEIERYSTISSHLTARNKVSEIIITNCK